MRRSIIVATAVAAAALALPAVASAHVVVTPGSVAPGGFATFTLSVPTEGNSPTRRVELSIPQSVTFGSYEAVRGWRITPVKTRSGRVYKLVVRGNLPVGQFQRFAFSAGVPETPTTLSWRAIQTYRNGRVVRWTGAPGSDTPASTTAVEGTPAGG